MTPNTDQRLVVRSKPAQHHVMYQTWTDLLFLHWEFPVDEIQATLPPGLTVDTFDGRAYVGVVPFYMRGIRPRFCPPVPGISNFLELNVRTYVHDKHGRPGVWFYSLDCNQALAVRVARKFFHLPYFDSRMSAPKHDARIAYECARKGDVGSSTRIDFQAGPALPQPLLGSLEFFLLERYLLFAYDSRKETLFSGQVHHVPYPICETSHDVISLGVLRLAGFDTPASAPVHAVMSPGVDVRVYPLQKVV